MGELVALNTQSLREPAASDYARQLTRTLRAARLSSAFVDRRRLDGSLAILSEGTARGVYDNFFVDSRSGLPNLASLTRAVTDHAMAVTSGPVLDQRRQGYRDRIKPLVPCPVDEAGVQIRRHDPRTATAEVRFVLTKLLGSGLLGKVTVDLTQVGGVWARELVKIDSDTEAAEATSDLRTTVYRLAAYDTEALFLRLHEVAGVSVTRVERTVIGPVLFALPCEGRVIGPREVPVDALTSRWAAALGEGPVTGPEILASFATDVADVNLKEDRSNDPLARLLGDGVTPSRDDDYRALRGRYPFRVYKDRKFVATTRLTAAAQELCAEAGTKNLIYRV